MSEQALKTQYGVVARSSRPGPLPFVLKDGETFAVFDPLGDVCPEHGDDLGVFHEGARHVSRLEMRLWGQAPLLLSSTVREDNCMLVAHLTNPDLSRAGIEKGRLHIQRSSVLGPSSCHQQIAITSYNDHSIAVPVTFCFDADFRDIFEIRGMQRARRGELRRQADDGRIRLVYRGLDDQDRTSTLTLNHAISEAQANASSCEIHIAPKQTIRLCLCIDFRDGGSPGEAGNRFDASLQRTIDRFRDARQSAANIQTSNEQFNQWLNRSFSDVHLLATPTQAGLYSYAGVPWFSAPFGRDGIITARQLLTVEPQLARGVLAYLAAQQATEPDAANDAEPGKILHESRLGEMAALREIPFARYYGSIDSTPLFLMLAGDYLKRTGDLDFIRSIWSNLEAAVQWIRRWGDRDSDGFIEYQRGADTGLRNQGWKDSEDSISHADGSLATGPIALCEVQGYVYAALRSAQRIASAMGRHDQATTFKRDAEQLRKRFTEVFWRPKLGTYALALDGTKKPCEVQTSNAGHCLWTGIATPEHAASIARSLLSPSSFNGFGIRTLDENEARYNPMSYHNGSVWPHDNAMIALGLARYGHTAEALRIMTGLFDASIFMPMHRLPELFCGVTRRNDEGPTLYPVACMPQSWASGAVFATLEAVTGMSLSIDSRTDRPTIRFNDLALPPYLQHVQIDGLRVGDESVDLELHRYDTDVGVQTTQRSPHVDIVITK